MKNFGEKERFCEAAFQSRQPYWHTYTCGKDIPILFTDNRDMALAMNIIAQAAFIYTGKVTIIAFAVMNNHFHFVLEGELLLVNEMLLFILKRIRRALSLEKLPEVSSKPIEDIASMRNHIVYVHRNGYIANLNHTPFSYPWGTGAHFFLPTSYGKRDEDRLRCYLKLNGSRIPRTMLRYAIEKFPSEERSAILKAFQDRKLNRI